jgi:hypothetical protein
VFHSLLHRWLLATRLCAGVVSAAFVAVLTRNKARVVLSNVALWRVLEIIVAAEQLSQVFSVLFLQ